MIHRFEAMRKPALSAIESTSAAIPDRGRKNSLPGGENCGKILLFVIRFSLIKYFTCFGERAGISLRF